MRPKFPLFHVCSCLFGAAAIAYCYWASNVMPELDDMPAEIALISGGIFLSVAVLYTVWWFRAALTDGGE